MKNKFKHIVKNAKSVSLSDEDRESMRSLLENHMADNPIVSTSGGFEAPRNFSSLISDWFGRAQDFFNNNSFNNKRVFVPVAIALVFVAYGGTALASQNSLPGDLLYPIKILNEKVSASLAVGVTARANIRSEHAINRLKEAETLSAQGRLDEKTNEEIKESFLKNSIDAMASIKDWEDQDKEGADKANLGFKGEIESHQGVLKSIDISDKQTLLGQVSPKWGDIVNVLIAPPQGYSSENQDNQNNDNDVNKKKLDNKENTTNNDSVRAGAENNFELDSRSSSTQNLNTNGASDLNSTVDVKKNSEINKLIPNVDVRASVESSIKSSLSGVGNRSIPKVGL